MFPPNIKSIRPVSADAFSGFLKLVYVAKLPEILSGLVLVRISNMQKLGSLLSGTLYRLRNSSLTETGDETPVMILYAESSFPVDELCGHIIQ